MPDVIIPTSPAELEEMLGDPQRMQGVFGDKELFGQFIRNYARTVMAKDEGIATQVREETQRVMAQWLRDNQADQIKRPNLDPATPVAGRSVKGQGLYNPKAMGAPLDAEFASSAEYFSAIWHYRQRDPDLENKVKRVRAAFSSTVPSEGGFLIPETLRSELLRVSLETSIVRPRARVVPMETLRVPFPAIDSTSNVSSVFGGIVGYWTEEAAALNASSASFGRVVLDAKKLTAYTEVPNELISDSLVSFQAFMDEIFPEALGFYEDYAFITGSGVGEPLGFLNGPALISVTRATVDVFAWADIVKMYARMLPSSLGRAVWLASPDVFPQLATMTISGSTIPLLLTGGQGLAGPTFTLLGRPIIFSEKIPQLTDPNALCFVDLGFYLLGDRQVMSAMSSPHFKFQNDVTAYRIVERVDGRPWLNSAITPRNSSATLSPFVGCTT